MPSGALTLNLEGDSANRIAAELAGFAKESDLATLDALKRIGGKVRTLTTKKVAADIGVAQKHIRRQIRVFPGNRRNMRVRVWAGVRKGVRYKEVGAKVQSASPTGATFVTTVGKDHVGLFYKNHPKSPTPRRRRVSFHPGRRDPKGTGDLPIREVSISIADPVNRSMPSISDRLMRSEYPDLYWRDFTRRITRTGRWRRR